MNDKDKEAFECWLENNTTTQEEIEAYEAMSEKDRVMFCMKYTWQAACEYKREEYSNIMNAMTQTSQYNFKLQAENKKLREVLEFYADQSSWMGYHRDVDTIRSCDCEPAKAREDEFDILLGGKRAREALKEVGEK